MTRSMTIDEDERLRGDTTLGGSSKSRLVVARLAAAPAAAAAAAASKFDVVVIVWRERREREEEEEEEEEEERRRRRRRRRKRRIFKVEESHLERCLSLAFFLFIFFVQCVRTCKKKKKKRKKKKKKKKKFQRFQRFKRRAAGASCEWFRSGLLLPSNAYGLVRKTPSVVGVCRPHSESERREEGGHVDASNAYGLVLFVRRALTGGVGCEDTDRRSSSAT
ncbi:unnamed protein product [Trichogramma brassicae]|uniref:Uncharacterized protein n=1 Tax=Trichogramma brassicae TaxID=86971 RepID=A0A6H5J741_9HYME|nr:unnamed protein product [Trichogramma brassicae]